MTAHFPFRIRVTIPTWRRRVAFGFIRLAAVATFTLAAIGLGALARPIADLVARRTATFMARGVRLEPIA